jgi:hypothetical protein
VTIDRSIDSLYECERWVWALAPGDRITVWDDPPARERTTEHLVAGAWSHDGEFLWAWISCVNERTGIEASHVSFERIADLISKADGSHIQVDR